MYKDIESILIINKYLTCCKLNEPNSKKTKLVQKYLTSRISKILNNKETPKRNLLNYISILPIIFIK
jgi:hypothetical protein